MKLVIVTSVEEYQKEVLDFFKSANIENLSTSDIDGYKNIAPVLLSSNWFSAEKAGNESRLFFSFTDDEHIDLLFGLIQEFNNNLETTNFVKAIVVPVERYI